MKLVIRRFYIHVLFLLTTAAVIAQPTVEATTAPTTAENSLLWKITSDKQTTPSYLYGTIHMIPAEDYALREEVTEVFATADEVVFEIDMDEMNNPMAMMGIMSKMYMEGGKTIKDLLDSAEYAMVNDHFSSKGLPMFAMERIKPMFLSVLAGIDMEGMKPGESSGGGMPGMNLGEGMKSYEMEFTEMARAAEKPIAGLETMEFQMSIFDSIPYEAQAKMLVESVRAEVEGTDDNINDLDAMVKLYLEENIVEMVGMVAQDSEMAEFEDVILIQRNRNWIPIMAEMMADRTLFFAVGAGHLAGEEGVVALLRQEGYSVEPIFAK